MGGGPQTNPYGDHERECMDEMHRPERAKEVSLARGHVASGHRAGLNHEAHILL